MQQSKLLASFALLQRSAPCLHSEGQQPLATAGPHVTHLELGRPAGAALHHRLLLLLLLGPGLCMGGGRQVPGAGGGLLGCGLGREGAGARLRAAVDQQGVYGVPRSAHRAGQLGSVGLLHGTQAGRRCTKLFGRQALVPVHSAHTSMVASCLEGSCQMARSSWI